MSDLGASPDDPNSSKNISMMAGSPPPEAEPQNPTAEEQQQSRTRAVPPQQRGKDWALRQKPDRSVPVRRPIRVVVRQNQLAILADGAASTPNAPGKVVPLNGDTVLAVDDFVKQVQSQIDGWGIAGKGLHWRPVIILTVGPDGQKRADDLARLLRNSGLELRMNETAAKSPEVQKNETR
jgi:hypothetical protein